MCQPSIQCLIKIFLSIICILTPIASYSHPIDERKSLGHIDVCMCLSEAVFNPFIATAAV